MLPIQERDATNSVTREYTWGLNLGGGIGGLLQMKQQGSVYSYLYDGKGNVSALIDSAQQLVAKYRYDVYGNLQAEVGTVSQPYLFSTKRYDYQLGTYYYGYRFYSPSTGRWLTRDPLGEAGGLNLYGFVGNDPVNWVDPEGEHPLVIILGIIGSFTFGYHIGDWIMDVKENAETLEKIDQCSVGQGDLSEEEKAAIEYGKLRVQSFRETVEVHQSGTRIPGTLTGGLPPGVRPTR